MNVRSYIAEKLKIVSHTEGVVEASIVFDDAFPAFKGHFPGNPTLPGVCELICVEILLEKISGKNVSLTELSRTKFFSPVSPGESLRIELSGLPADAGALSDAALSVKIFSEDRKIAFFTNCRFR